MKRIISLIGLVILLSALKSKAQYGSARVPFSEGECKIMEEKVQDFIDSLYDALIPDESYRLILFSVKEQKERTHQQLQSLSMKRADLIASYCSARKLAPEEVLLEVVPFDQKKKKKNVQEVSNATYRDFAKPPTGAYSIVLKKGNYYYKPYTRLANKDRILKDTLVSLIDCETGGTVYGRDGMLVVIPPNAFADKTGKSCPCNPIEFRSMEFFTLEDMIAADLTTRSGERWLETGGMVYLEARCGHQALQLAKGKRLQVYLPFDTFKKDMKVFNGRMTNGLFDWRLNEAGKVSNSNEQEQVYDDEEGEWRGEMESQGDSYLLSITQLGWINCDRFIDEKEKTDLLVSSDLKGTTLCYRLIFKDIKSILPAYSYGPRGEYKFDEIPKGKEVKVLAYAKTKSGNFYFGSLDAITGDDKKLQLSGLRELTEAEFKKELKNLTF